MDFHVYGFINNIFINKRPRLPMQLDTTKARGRAMRCFGAALEKPKGPVQPRAAAFLAYRASQGGKRPRQNLTDRNVPTAPHGVC